jgi:hypothetical protein
MGMNKEMKKTTVTTERMMSLKILIPLIIEVAAMAPTTMMLAMASQEEYKLTRTLSEGTIQRVMQTRANTTSTVKMP